MSYITARIARLKAQLARVQTALAALYETYTDLAARGVESYLFDSGEGSQRSTRRKLSEIHNQIAQLEATEEHLLNELSGVGLVSTQLRRKTQ